MKAQIRSSHILLVTGAMLLAGANAFSADDTNVVSMAKTSSGERRDLTELSIAELLDYPVTIGTRSGKPLSQSATAISVITAEDIRRSGVTSIPEALRMAPGLEVARLSSHQYAVSSRGFNDAFANKLLVMIDGRSVYTPLFSGVFWDVQDTMLEDIDRIEVVRGPGATLWGANAVNGVINIITKSSAETQGTLLSVGAGTEERGFANVRYGGKVNDETTFRIFGKYFNRDDSAAVGGGDAHDAWEMGRAGLRLDWQPSDENTFSFQGGIYSGKIEETFIRTTPIPPFAFFNDRSTYEARGGHVLGSWTRTISDNSSFTLQSYYDRTLRDTDIFEETRDTFDLDFQHLFSLGDRNNLIWGTAYRATSDDINNTFDVSLTPDDRTTHLFSAFVQDEIILIPETLSLTLGSKLEHNDFTGFEVQPSVRMLWMPHQQHSFWASVARAVRTPSRAEDDVRLNQGAAPAPAPPGTLLSAFGDRSFNSEELIAYELGYRLQPHERLSFDLATFYNDYDRLRSVQFGMPFPEPAPAPPHLVLPILIQNDLEGETYGFELSSKWQALDWWRLVANYSYLQIQLHSKSNPPDSTTERNTEGASPHHQFSLRSQMDFPGNVEFDAALRYVDSLPGIGVSSYLVLDLRVGWQATENLEFSIAAQNLLDSKHQEFAPTTIATQPAEIEHSIYGKITWRF